MQKPEDPPEAVIALLARFAEGYTQGDEPTTDSLWRDYIAPFFSALGWNFQDTITPGRILGGHTRHIAITPRGGITYTGCVFLASGVPRFLVILLTSREGDSEDSFTVFRLCRYAWSAEIPLLVLSSVGSWSVYDCTSEPVPGETGTGSRIATFTGQNLRDAWAGIFPLLRMEPLPGHPVPGAAGRRQIADTAGRIPQTRELCRDPATNGTWFMPVDIEKRGASLTSRSVGVAQVLLQDLESWRKALARDIAIHRHGIATAGLNDAVHQSIYRTIFLQICQDRGIGLTESVLAHFPGEIEQIPDPSPGVARITRRICGPDSCYDLSAIPVSTLATVFGRFLEKTVRMKGGHHPEVEVRPGIRATGQDPVPAPLVAGYLARQVVLDLFTGGRGPCDVAGIRILDYACGSGLFLSAVYQALLDWHIDWYSTNLFRTCSVNFPGVSMGTGTYPAATVDTAGFVAEADGTVPVLLNYLPGDSGRKGTGRLTCGEKARILGGMLYGVDIDRQAVGATILLLVMHLLRDEDGKDPELPGILEFVLLRLRDHIRCGNALVGPDYFDLGQSYPYQFREEQKVNPFDWHKIFPFTTPGGGFDAIIGNPPSRGEDTTHEQARYLQAHYCVYRDSTDLTPFFIEKGLSLLVPGGILSVCVSCGWLRARYGTPLRVYLAGRQILEITTLGGEPGAAGSTCLLRLSNTRSEYPFMASHIKGPLGADLEDSIRIHGHPVDQATLRDGGWTLEDSRPAELLERLRGAGRPLGAYVMGQVTRGGRTMKYRGRELDADDIRRYERPGSVLNDSEAKKIPCSPAKDSRIFYRGRSRQPVPGIARFPARAAPSYPDQVPNRTNPGKGRSSGDILPRVQSRILSPSHALHPSFTLETEGRPVTGEVTIIPYPDLYLLGLLNARITDFFIRMTVPREENGTYPYTPRALSRLPVFVPDFDDERDKELHDRVEHLVSRLLALHEQLRITPQGPWREFITGEIRVADEAIDDAVYSFYGITAEEKSVIDREIGRKGD